MRNRMEPTQPTPKSADFYRELGSKGGTRTKERYGAEFFAQIGRKGGSTAKVRGLTKAGAASC